MSLITRCPACATQFRVVPDQLKISDGWVRCGQCNEVFDAQAALVSVAPAEAAPEAPAMPQPVPAPLPSPVTEAAPAPRPEPEPEPEPVVLEARAADDFADTTADDGPAFEPTDLPQPPEPLHPVEPVAERMSEGLSEGLSEAAAEPVESPEPALDEVSFVRQARRRAFWHRPLVRVALVLLALLLGLLLAAQVAIQQRDILAQQLPALRPVLVALCQPVGCRVGLPRHIEALVIDNSGFARLRPDAYRLTVTLANQSPVAVALPALELTLTDSLDQPVLRRVIAPAELVQGAAGLIGANAQWSATLTVAVTPDAANARIVGYRLLAFYP